MRCAQTLDVGVYVLGALAPAERDAFERHLGDCAICRDEVAELAVLPGLLGRLDLATAETIARDGEAAPAIRDGRAAAPAEMSDRWVTEPPVEQDDVADPAPDPERWAGPTVVSLLDGARHRRKAQQRRRRYVTIAAGLVAACLALVVGLSTTVFLRDNGPSMTPMTAAVAGAQLPVSAELAFQPIAGGTRVIMHCAYKNPDQPGTKWKFTLVAVSAAGAEQELGNWSAGDGDDFRMEATTSLQPNEIKRTEIRRENGPAVLKLDR
jgi:hypothetical protein